MKLPPVTVPLRHGNFPAGSYNWHLIGPWRYAAWTISAISDASRLMSPASTGVDAPITLELNQSRHFGAALTFRGRSVELTQPRVNGGLRHLALSKRMEGEPCAPQIAVGHNRRDQC
jgi:hypothetical protein